MRKYCVYKNIIGPDTGKTCGRWVKGWNGEPHPLCYQHKRYAYIFSNEASIGKEEEDGSGDDSSESN